MRILLEQLVQFHKRIEGCSVISHHHKVIGLKKLVVFLYLKVFDACTCHDTDLTRHQIIQLLCFLQ